MTEPSIRIVRGEPTAEELAALVTVLAAAGRRPVPAAPPSAWRDRTALVGAPLRPGPGAWRASGLPR